MLLFAPSQLPDMNCEKLSHRETLIKIVCIASVCLAIWTKATSLIYGRLDLQWEDCT